MLYAFEMSEKKYSYIPGVICHALPEISSEQWRWHFRKLFMILASAIILYAGSGCTETIELELESVSRRLVVDGMVMSDQKMHYVRLTESVSFFNDSASPPVSGADVFLSDGEQIERLVESGELPGFYISSGEIEGEPGKTYSLSISGVDIDDDGVEESYSARSYLPPVTAPDSIEMVYDEGWEIWKVLLYASDNPETEDYYLFRVYKNGSLMSDNLSEFSIVSDKFFDGGTADGVWIQSIDAGSNNDLFEPDDVITLQMCGITEEYYRFVESVQRENRRRYPLFSGPPANAKGNVTNGALGFFTAFSAKYASYRFTEDDLMQ
jgi:hypothetical protein